VGDSDPFVAARDLLAGGDFDEVIVSTLPEHVSRWLGRDLPHRIEQLGVPVGRHRALGAARIAII
jgi:hypothetical protein